MNLTDDHEGNCFFTINVLIEKFFVYSYEVSTGTPTGDDERSDSKLKKKHKFNSAFIVLRVNVIE